MAGKGSKQRPTDLERFGKNHDRIFGKIREEYAGLDPNDKQVREIARLRKEKADAR